MRKDRVRRALALVCCCLILSINVSVASTLQGFAAADYIFPAQAPGGALYAGVNTITLTPCPLGLAGTDTNHYVYISDGVGGGEPVLIVGGTCAPGAASGTI